MPIYEYVCRDCGHELEQLQRLSDAKLTDCPACGEAALKRKISAAGFRLAGGGWYETDFKSDRQRNLAGEGDTSKADNNKGDNKKTDNGDAKPAANTSDSKKNDATPSKPADKTGAATKADKPSNASGGQNKNAGSNA